ncbi:phenazine biosynthesis protein-like protein phzf family [Xylariaceae sp. FL1651]|nr:phenazine biosynthesis protein-like protein phzf family [Xylariaceae sp. FL1651]
MALVFTTLDVFTTTPFRGNPVAIVHVPIGSNLSQAQKQLIAREFNLSESVFLHEQTPEDIQAGHARIDIFTTIAEVPFAGHPTVGTSNYLAHHLKNPSVKALVTKAGLLPFHVPRDGDGDGAGIQLSVAHDVRVHNQPFAGTDFGHFPVVSIVKGMTFILARQPDLDALAKATQNLLGTESTYASYAALDEGYRVGIVTSYFYVDLGVDESGTRQLRTRMFGSREDPATGSAASALCSYLSLTDKDGPLVRRYQVTQGVEMGRQSDISLRVTVNGSRTAVEEVLLSGTAVKVAEGKIGIPQI